MSKTTAEQKARDMIERITGMEQAQQLSAGAVVELANLIAARDAAVEVVARFKSDVTAMGGYQNRFLGLYAGDVREYIDDLERVLDITN